MEQKNRKVLTFIAGLVTGIVLTILVLIIVANHKQERTGLNIYAEATEPFGEDDFFIFQAFPDGSALANAGNMISGPIVLLAPADGVTYYDDLEVHTPAGKTPMIAGTYEYSTKMNIKKTVPVIVFE